MKIIIGVVSLFEVIGASTIKGTLSRNSIGIYEKNRQPLKSTKLASAENKLIKDQSTNSKKICIPQSNPGVIGLTYRRTPKTLNFMRTGTNTPTPNSNSKDSNHKNTTSINSKNQSLAPRTSKNVQTLPNKNIKTRIHASDDLKTRNLSAISASKNQPIKNYINAEMSTLYSEIDSRINALQKELDLEICPITEEPSLSEDSEEKLLIDESENELMQKNQNLMGIDKVLFEDSDEIGTKERETSISNASTRNSSRKSSVFDDDEIVEDITGESVKHPKFAYNFENLSKNLFPSSSNTALISNNNVASTNSKSGDSGKSLDNLLALRMKLINMKNETRKRNEYNFKPEKTTNTASALNSQEAKEKRTMFEIKLSRLRRENGQQPKKFFD